MDGVGGGGVSRLHPHSGYRGRGCASQLLDTFQTPITVRDCSYMSTEAMRRVCVWGASGTFSTLVFLNNCNHLWQDENDQGLGAFSSSLKYIFA